jgi:1-acyl-sn-glycerol-3-phosphate acyltransferase
MPDLIMPLRFVCKAVLFIIFVVSFIVACLFWRLWTRDFFRRRRLYNYTVKFYCRLALWLMGLKLNVINRPDEERPYLLVSNHLGILDILLLASVKPTLFVTSVEMKNTPFLGLLTEMGGCLYVERRDRSNIRNEMSEIRHALENGLSVALYPEGMTNFTHFIADITAISSFNIKTATHFCQQPQKRSIFHFNRGHKQGRLHRGEQ